MAENRKLGRTADHRVAMLKNQVTSLIWHGQIITTEQKAKEVKSIADSLIALAIKEKDDEICQTIKSIKYLKANYRQIPTDEMKNSEFNKYTIVSKCLKQHPYELMFGVFDNYVSIMYGESIRFIKNIDIHPWDYYKDDMTIEEYKSIIQDLKVKIDLLLDDLLYKEVKEERNDNSISEMIDEEIIKKAKEEDSSYDSEESKNIIKKDKEQEIKEFYLKKKNVVVKKEERPKINYIYNIGNNSKQYKEDKQNNNNLEEKKEELESFNNVIGNINIDLEHLFNKYRPESGSIKNDKKYKNNRYKNKNKNKTLEDGGEWVNVNIDNLVEEFLKTKTELKKDKKEKKLDDKKSKKSSKKSSNNKVSIEKEKSKKESLDEEKKENDEDEKEDNDKENKKESEEENEEENEEEKDNKDEQEMNDEFYENLYGDIYDFQQSLKNEVMREQENNNKTTTNQHC